MRDGEVGRKPMGGATEVAKRYEELGIAAALVRPWDYPTACHELGLILRLAYPKLPKSLQSAVFRDILSAFRLLPEVQTGYGISAANMLLQAAETALPKQKKAIAVSEFKHSVVARKRRSKAHPNEGSLQLPHDVLDHIFGFLDMRSLVAVSFVCRAWNSAAEDNRLWQTQFSLFFGNSGISCINILESHRLVWEKSDSVARDSNQEVDLLTKFSWKKAFQRKYKAYRPYRFNSNRALCTRCRSIIWLSNMTCSTSHDCHKGVPHQVKIRPVLPNKVVSYLLGVSQLGTSSDSHDSDSDEISSDAP